MKKIIISGYMGSGKSTIARLLHQKTGIKLADTDKIIEEKSQLTVAEIFASKGEIYFRKLEHDVFTELLASDENLIISLGGGTPCYANNHELLVGENRISIYLKASIDTLYDRISAHPNERPLIAGKSEKEMKEYIAKHLFDRSYYYNHSMHKINTDGRMPEEIVSEIEKLLA